MGGEGTRLSAAVLGLLAVGVVAGALFLVLGEGDAPAPRAPRENLDEPTTRTTLTAVRVLEPDGGEALVSDAGLVAALAADAAPQVPVDAGPAFDAGVGVNADGRTILAGEVRDTLARAVPGARVRLTRKDASSFVDVTTVTTGSDGRFRAEVPAGTLVVEAKATGYKTHIVDELPITAGETKFIELTLSVGQRIMGRVLDDAGEPVPGVTVTAVPPAEDDSGDQVRTSDRDGRFAFDELGAGPYCIYARRPPYVDGERCGVKPGDAELSIKLGRAGGIAGRVQRVVGALPVTRFHASAKREDVDDETDMPTASQDFVSPTGEFRLGELAPGRYAVTIRAEGRLFAERAGVEVRAGETTSGLVFELGSSGRISGVVLAKVDGRPIARAKVELLLGGRGRGLTVITDESGRFEFDRVSAAAHQLNVEVAGFRPILLYRVPRSALSGQTLTLTMQAR